MPNPNQQEILTFEDFVASNPQAYESFKNSPLFQALYNSLLIQLNQTQTALLRADMTTEQDVRQWNHDQGAMITLEAVLLKLSDPLHLNEEPEEELAY